MTLETVGANSPEKVALLRDALDMIAIRTSNPPGDELALAEWLAVRLQQIGMTTEIQLVSENRANCVGTVDFGPGPTVVLCTHLDVVPASKESTWEGRVEGGRLYGRGACDAKGPLAAMVAAAARLIDGEGLTGRLVLAAVADEETDAQGALRFTRDLETADGVIIGEPTNNRPVLSSRGALRLAIDFAGEPSHSSTPDNGVNAVHAAARFIVVGENYHHELSKRGTAATHSATVIHGGTKLNIIPDACRVLVDRRLAPGETLDGALREIENLLVGLRSENGDLSWSISEAGVWLEPFDLPHDSGFGAKILTAVGDAAPGPMFPGGTDAPHFIAKGVPAVILGPGSLDQAHSDDEWVELAELETAVDLYERCALALLRPPL
jgi:succinyl-diaminopimelate desuccinylase